MELRKHGVPIRLQEQPFRILAALAERPSQVVTREELQGQIWGKGHVQSSAKPVSESLPVADTKGSSRRRQGETSFLEPH
jgi:DNA-binding winged helix-turn-helix (wHTH) protein